MISKLTIKHIKSLYIKKFRKHHKMFLVEGEKFVNELLKSTFSYEKIYAIKEWVDTLKSKHILSNKVEIVTEKELSQISGLKSPNKVVAIVNDTNYKLNYAELKKDLFLVLDKINNPGNLGTILRIADWFGIKNIVCSFDSVEYSNPKVLQASMGSVFRVKTHYINLVKFVENCQKKGIKLIGSSLHGDNIYEVKFPASFGLVLGNESHGVSKDITSKLDYSISIPKYNNRKIDSLNVAIASSIILSEVIRVTQK